MFSKIKLSEIFHNIQLRFFNTTSMSGRASKLVQFHSGGDDYCPSKECEGLGENIGGNPADGFILAWRDDVRRISEEGEKRLYSLLIDKETGQVVRNEETGEMIVAAELLFKNNGQILINCGKEATGEAPALNIIVVGDCNVEANNLNAKVQTANVKASASVNIDSPLTNIGKSGKGIARLGDEVEVEVTSGSSAGTWKGKITSSGVNTSI